MFAVPQTNPHAPLERPVSSGEEMLFLSAIYESLETNIPKSLMGYSDLPFDDNLQLFPRHESVQAYLETYAEDLLPHIRFQKKVVDVRPDKLQSWVLEYQDLTSDDRHTEPFDAVIVATGHFSMPYVPRIDGLEEWNRMYPDSISHSKYYRAPDSVGGKKVIVIGSSASGLDIASQISPVCKTPLLLSQKSVSYLAAGFAEDSNIETVPQITRVNASTREVFFSNDRIEKGVDHLLFCTGYLYSMPFLESLQPNPISDGTRVEHTYQHLFYAARHTLAFLTLNQKVIPFPLAEAQSAVLARVYSGRLSLPPQLEMEAWERSVIAERGNGGDFHTLKFPKDAEYINALYDWAASAEKRNGLESGGIGKLSKRWGAWEYWARENFPAIRKAFISHGEERKDIKSLKELGFEFSADAKVANPGVKDEQALL
jgi:cation diffusion facilitator CzcD-associated flavoprotein CzcO